MTRQDEDNKAIFTEYNVGEKLMITDDDGEVHFGIIQSFGYDVHGDVVLWVDMVGRREIHPYNPRKSAYQIEVLT